MEKIFQSYEEIYLNQILIIQHHKIIQKVYLFFLIINFSLISFFVYYLFENNSYYIYPLGIYCSLYIIYFYYNFLNLEDKINDIVLEHFKIFQKIDKKELIINNFLKETDIKYIETIKKKIKDEFNSNR